MKKLLNLFSRFVVATVAALALCGAGAVFGQETAASPGTTDPDTSAATTAAQPSATPEKAFSTSAGVGAKPSKAELAKKNAGAGNQNATSAAALASQDQEFIMKAAMGGMKEVQMGQMAEQKGQSPDVKKIGNRIAADHTKANNELIGLATKKGVKINPKQKMDMMSKKDMENFDQAWLGMMVTDHQKDIALYEKEAKTGGDPELKSFAGKTLPVLKKHLSTVQGAQKKMGSATTAPPKNG